MTTSERNEIKIARLEEKHDGLLAQVVDSNKEHATIFKLLEDALGGLNQLKGMVWIISVGIPIILTIIGYILHMSNK